jgi:putative DNA primase/helicase
VSGAILHAAGELVAAGIIPELLPDVLEARLRLLHEPHADAVLAGEETPDLARLAALVAADGIDFREAEDLLLGDCDRAIFDAEHSLNHPTAGDDQRWLTGEIKRLGAVRDRREREWADALHAAEFALDLVRDEIESASAPVTHAALVEAVRARIQAAEPPALASGIPAYRVPAPDVPPYDAAAARIAELAQQGLKPAAAPFALPTAAPAEVRAAAFSAIRGFFMQRSVQPPPRIIVPAMTGAGKTRAGETLLPHIILADQAERALPGRENTPWRTIIMVPAHRLGRQIKRRYQGVLAQHGLTVATLEGRGDPWSPAKPSRPYLCTNLEAVGLAIMAKADVHSAVCISGTRRCPFHDGCSYLAQYAEAAAADVLIVAHEFLFENLPASVVHNVATVIVEEEFTATGDAISDLPLDPLRKNAIDAAPAYSKRELDLSATADLHRYAERLVAMLDGEPDGYLADDAPSRYHLVPSDFRYLRFLNWKRKRNADMHPGMTLAERREAQHAVAINQQLPKIAAMLHMLANGETGRLRLTTDGKGRRSIVLHGKRERAAWLADKPILFLNATARLPDVQRFFGSATLIEQPRARIEHQRVHQFLGSFGKGAMTNKKVADLVARARRHLAAGKAVLVICHEQIEDVFKALPEARPVEDGLPQLRVLHHGDYAGDDDHGDVDVVMHIGGPFATARQIAELATARFGVPVPIAKPVRVPCVALMEDGTGVQFERMGYEHPAAQFVHEGIYDTSPIQGALGRGRGINRTAETPLEIEVFGNMPLPVPLASLSRWRPSREPDLLARGGTHSNARDLYRFHPDQFDSEGAAAKWRQRHPWDEAHLRDLLADDPRPHARVTWQPQGQGHKPRISVIPRADVPALHRRAKREFQANMAVWTVEEFTRGDESDKRTNGVRQMSDSSPVAVPPQALDWPIWATRQPETRDHPPDG